MEMRMTRLLLSVATLAVAFGSALAGSLTPPPGPSAASTSVALQKIYEKKAVAMPVGKSGQTVCWDTAGNSIPCALSGQDGAHQAGVSVSPRFTDNKNGTVTDSLTGLVWLRDASCIPSQTWMNALSTAHHLSAASAPGGCLLTDGSLDLTWRLPNVEELNSLIDFGQSPALPPGHPFLGVVPASTCWSSTTVVLTGFTTQAWWVNLSGATDRGSKTGAFCVWPVRDAQ